MIDTEFRDINLFEPGGLTLRPITFFGAEPEKGYVPTYRFGMFIPKESSHVGTIDFRLGDSIFLTHFAGQVGYRVLSSFRGDHLAARSLRLLAQFAPVHGFQELWITCNPENIASRKSAEFAGAVFIEEVDTPKGSDLYERGETRKCRYRLGL